MLCSLYVLRFFKSYELFPKYKIESNHGRQRHGAALVAARTTGMQPTARSGTPTGDVPTKLGARHWGHRFDRMVFTTTIVPLTREGKEHAGRTRRAPSPHLPVRLGCGSRLSFPRQDEPWGPAAVSLLRFLLTSRGGEPGFSSSPTAMPPTPLLLPHFVQNDKQTSGQKAGEEWSMSWLEIA